MLALRLCEDKSGLKIDKHPRDGASHNFASRARSLIIFVQQFDLLKCVTLGPVWLNVIINTNITRDACSS